MMAWKKYGILITNKTVEKQMKPIICGKNSSKTFDSQNLKYIQLKENNITEIKDSPYILINTDNMSYAADMIKLIRLNSIPDIYLTPIFILNKSKLKLDKYIAKAVDKVIQLSTYFESKKIIHDIAEEINSCINSIPNHDSFSDRNISLKVLRYAYTRDQQLISMKGTNNYLGYTYPAIDFFFSTLDKNLYNMLDFLELNNLIRGTFLDRIFTCVKCSSAFINFKETCPKCKSNNLVLQELIHHFRCAYVGPIDDFIKGDNLICPKCHKLLKMLGNDHEKPSIINQCQSCSHSFQNAEVITECYNCGKENSPDDLIQKQIKQYLLEPLATSIVFHGMDNVFHRVISENLKLIPYHEFKKFLDIEINRIKRYKEFVDTLCILSINDLRKIYVELGSNSKSFFKELSKILTDIFRTSDVLCSYNSSTFLILMTNSPINKAKICKKRLTDSISKLLKYNLEHDFELVVEFSAVDSSKEADALIKEIITHAFN
ncbi:MAG: diguanylate cyclase [bacterium]|nr:diguanylate cyclase [bacterium]